MDVTGRTESDRQSNTDDDDLDDYERIENLEEGLATAKKVCEHLSSQLERYSAELDRVEQERDAWKAHARQLAKQLDALKRDQHGVAYEDFEVQMLSKVPKTLEPDPALLQAFDWPKDDPLLKAVLDKGTITGWLINPSEVRCGEVLGEGAFGITYRGIWRGADVAVKHVRIGSATELKNFLREVESLADLRHPNIVPFLGACIKSLDCCWILCEFMSGGNLAAWLDPEGSGRAAARPLLQRLQIALDVAQGMEAMEACQPPILHRDLKPSNVFLDASGAARIGDFGLARRLWPGGTATLTGETGTYLYMSPEMVRHEAYDIKTDVWSWGVMLAQLATGRLPYDNTFLTPIQIALAVADEKLAPALPPDLHPVLAAVGAMACSADPEMRPTFASIVEEMRAVLPSLRHKAEATTDRGVLGRLLGTGQLPRSWANVFSRVAGWA